MNEHTATPWKVMTGHPSRGLFVVGPPDDHGYTPEVCEVDKAEDMDANAAFIVRAANSHTALVAALRAVEWGGAAGGGGEACCPSCYGWPTAHAANPFDPSSRAEPAGHAPDCQLDNALRAAEPN